jgi:hypothetical protein
MQWQLKSRRGRGIASGTLAQMVYYLKFLLPDGEYQLEGSELTIPVRRYQGVVYPFDRWQGWRPAEGIDRLP